MTTARHKKTIEVWDVCECGRVLHSMAEGQRGTCSSCWVKAMPSDTKAAMNKLIASAFNGTARTEGPQLIDDAIAKLNRDSERKEG